MPPSTDTHVRRPSTSLRAPTVYSATPARATSDRPGSTNSRGGGEAVLLAAPQERRHDRLGVRLDGRRGLLAHVLRREAAAGAVLAQLAARACATISAANASITAFASSYGSSENSGEPRWQCSPISSTPRQPLRVGHRLLGRAGG